MEYLSSIVFHTVILKMLSKEAKSRNVALFLYSEIMDNLSSILYSTLSYRISFQKRQNQEMWLRYFIEDKVGVCIIDSIQHCFSKHFSMAVWNTIDDTYSNFFLYIVTKPHFLIFASFQSIFTMAVWNTIDDR